MAKAYHRSVPVSPVVVVSRRGVERLRSGHPWIYRSDVRRADASPGDLVSIQSERGRPLAWALWSSTSQIALRALGVDLDPADDAVWLRARIEAAAAYRAGLDIDASAWRVVNAEADRLPGLIVDRYGDDTGVYLVIQTLCQGMDRRLPVLVGVLTELFAPRGVLARNDPKVRRLEGLEERVDELAGEIPEVVDVREGAFHVRTSLREGQKTGLFLDQRENHVAAGRYAHGRAIDAFTYHGGFALALAGHVESVLALDSSAAAVAAARGNAARNQLTNVEVREVNVFDELRELEIARERFGTIVLDPPAFAKNKASLERAVAGYKEINLRALKLLEPGGILVSCSCSHHVSEALLLDIVADAAADAGATVTLLEKRMQSRDHPVLVGVPETSYLKCLVLRRVS
jgi:23S rRNA (cytosine1962-C5)-methyltransferase